MIKFNSGVQAGSAFMLISLSKMISKGTDAVVEMPSGEVFTILSGTKESFSHSQSQAPRSIRLSTLENYELISGGQSRPLAELLWRLGHEIFDQSDFNSADLGLRREDVFRLKKHPNLTRLPRTPNSVRIAMFLASRTTCPALAARYLHVEEPEVMRFYCAASTAGYVNVVSRVVTPAMESEPQIRKGNGLLSRIIEHLKGKSVSLQ
ncbi:MAG: hypothetical protein ACPGYX_06930 [Oceanobacter sp.]